MTLDVSIAITLGTWAVTLVAVIQALRVREEHARERIAEIKADLQAIRSKIGEVEEKGREGHNRLYRSYMATLIEVARLMGRAESSNAIPRPLQDELTPPWGHHLADLELKINQRVAKLTHPDKGDSDKHDKID